MTGRSSSGPDRDGSSHIGRSCPWKGDSETDFGRSRSARRTVRPSSRTVSCTLSTSRRGRTPTRSPPSTPRPANMKWEKSYDRAEFKPLFGNGPRSTPLVSGGKVFTLGGTGILACWDAKTGDIALEGRHAQGVQGQEPLLRHLDVARHGRRGQASSVMVGGKGAGVVAFDAKTGKTAWQSTDDPASYSSPMVADKQIVTLTGANLLGLSQKGEKLLVVPVQGPAERIVDDAGGRRRSRSSAVRSRLVRLRCELTARRAASISPEKVWENKALTCYFSTPVVVGDHLYMVNGAATLTNPSITAPVRRAEDRQGRLGEEERRRSTTPRSSAAAAADRNCSCSTTTASSRSSRRMPKEYKELARSKVCGEDMGAPGTRRRATSTCATKRITDAA